MRRSSAGGWVSRSEAREVLGAGARGDGEMGFLAGGFGGRIWWVDVGG